MRAKVGRRRPPPFSGPEGSSRFVRMLAARLMRPAAALPVRVAARRVPGYSDG
jgi:hypothetical protein